MSPQNRQLVRLMDVSKERPHWTERRLRRARAEHRIPCYVVDGRVFFDIGDLDAYDEAGRVEAAP